MRPFAPTPSGDPGAWGHDPALPLVSIVTPAYNAARFLEETIQSVLTQDYPKIECIVVDDGSTDQTPAIIARYADRVRCVRQANQGENPTVNTGLGLATGDIVSVVNADDPLRPGAVATAVQFLREHPAILAAYPDWLEIDAAGRVLQVMALPDYDIYRLLLGEGVALGPGVFIRRAAFDLIGRRTAGLKYTGDLDFWYRLSLHGGLGHIPALLATHRTHAAAASSSAKGRVMAAEVVRLVDTVFASPLLPPDLRRRRHQIYARNHRLARPFCGRAHGARLWHTLAGLYHRVLDREPPLPAYAPARAHLLGRLAKALAPVLLAGAHLGLRLLWRGSRVLWRGRPLARASAGALTLVTTAHGTADTARLTRLRALCARVPALRLTAVTPPHRSGAATLDPSGYLAPAYPAGGPAGPLRDLRDGLFILTRVVAHGWRLAAAADTAGCALLFATGEWLDPPAAALAAVLARKPLMLYLFDDYATQWQGSRLLHRWARPLAHYALARATAVVATNPGLAHGLQHRYGVPVARVPCPSLATDAPAQRVPRPRRTAPRMMALIAPFQDEGLTGTVAAALRLLTPARLGLASGSPQAADLLLIALPFAPTAATALLSWAPLELPEYLRSNCPLIILAPDYAYLSGLARTHDCALLVDRDEPRRLAAALAQVLDEPAVAARISANAAALAHRDEDPEHAAHLLAGLIAGQRAAAGAGLPGGCG